MFNTCVEALENVHLCTCAFVCKLVVPAKYVFTADCHITLGIRRRQQRIAVVLAPAIVIDSCASPSSP